MDRIERLLAERERAWKQLEGETGGIGREIALIRYRDALVALTLALMEMVDG